MTASVFSSLGFMLFLNFLLLLWTTLSLSSATGSSGKRHRSPVGREAQDFLSQFLSTLNLTELRPQPRPLVAHGEPPEYMLELYNRFANDRTSANIVRSFKNEDSSPYSLTTRGVWIFPLLFNITVPRNEHITIAELHLFTLVQKAQRPRPGQDCEVTIYSKHEGVAWTKEVGTQERRSDTGGLVELTDLEELMTKRIHAKDNTWVSFDLTHVVGQWLKSGCATRRLEVHVASLGAANKGLKREHGESLVEVDVDRSLDGKHNAMMIVFSDDERKDRQRDKKEITQIMEHENDLRENVRHDQQSSRDPVGGNAANVNQDDLDKQSLVQLPSRIRRNAKNQPCKRTPLYVDFKEIGWDTWIIQPMGYEAYECNGVCNPPMTSEVSPTKHAIVQTLLSVKSPGRASRACCVPTKLEPISLLYHDNGIITFMQKYEGMVVAECGCR